MKRCSDKRQKIKTDSNDLLFVGKRKGILIPQRTLCLAGTGATSRMASTAMKPEVNPAGATTVQDENARSSACGESEILRSRLLCSRSSSSAGEGHVLNLKKEIAQNSTSGGATMSSSSSLSSTLYPKCNISLSMSANNEHLTVITSSVASGESNAAKMVSTGASSSGVNYGIATSGMNTTSVPTFSAQLLRSNEKIPPEIELKPVIVGVTQSSLQSGPPTMTPTCAPHIPVAEVKKEATVLTIPYDRERILNFLTDYWKSKNMQQVTEAQQQTAGVSGVASSDFCPAPQRIVEEALFDLFVEYPMIIDGLAISKRAWAKAFYEKDIIQTSKVLFEALFSEQEMQQCTLNGKKGTPELSAIKMLAILRTAAWMKNKKQDPYSFNTNIPSHNQFPTNEEREKIEKKVFTERRSQANRKLTKNCDNAGSSPSSSRDTTSPEAPNHGSPSSGRPDSSGSASGFGASPAGENRLSLSDDLRREHMAPLAKIPRLDLDTEIVKQLQMLYAENPEGLISYLLPNTRAILIDGFLIPYDDWTKAFNETGSDIVKAAWTLFKVLFSKTEILNCTLNGKNGTRELCPVKKLAILRAITWMKENQGTTVDIFTFNVRRPEFNCFPSDEDKDKIETKVYTEKRYQACRKLKGQLM